MATRSAPSNKPTPWPGFVPDIDRTSLPSRSDWNSGLSGVGTSTVVHVIAIAIAASIYFANPTSRFVADLDSRWTEPAPAQLEIDYQDEASQGAGDQDSQSDTDQASASEMVVLQSDSLVDNLDVADPMITETRVEGGTGKRSAPKRSGKKSDTGKKQEALAGSDQPKGDGDTGGNRAGFFGKRSNGNRIIFVVDNSGSMNQLHGVGVETRYSRVKAELVTSIMEMSDQNEFFVIFFSDRAYPMRSRTMQRATLPMKERHLEWIAEVTTGGGPTNPCGSLEFALRLRPDVIYFLTDGEFERDINLRLIAIKQTDAVIHTFAFGERSGEEILKQVASHNDGEYTFIP